MAALDLETPAETKVETKTVELVEASPTKTQTYTTVLGTMEDGKIVFPEHVDFPDGTPVLVTVLQKNVDEVPPADYESYTDEEFDNMTVGEQIIAGLKDIIAGRYVTISSKEEMDEYLDEIFEEE